MAEPPIEIPAELAPRLGDAIKGWNNASTAFGVTLPTRLRRANLIRRGAKTLLQTPTRTKR